MVNKTLSNIISSARNYLVNDLQQTKTDLSDLSILARRAVGLSYYGFKNGREMTSREKKEFLWDLTALWFPSQQEFTNYLSQNLWPVGRCKVGWGKNALRYDDSLLN